MTNCIIKLVTWHLSENFLISCKPGLGRIDLTDKLKNIWSVVYFSPFWNFDRESIFVNIDFTLSEIVQNLIQNSPAFLLQIALTVSTNRSSFLCYKTVQVLQIGSMTYKTVCVAKRSDSLQSVFNIGVQINLILGINVVNKTQQSENHRAQDCEVQRKVRGKPQTVRHICHLFMSLPNQTLRPGLITSTDKTNFKSD